MLLHFQQYVTYMLGRVYNKGSFDISFLFELQFHGSCMYGLLSNTIHERVNFLQLRISSVSITQNNFVFYKLIKNNSKMTNTGNSSQRQWNYSFHLFLPLGETSWQIHHGHVLPSVRLSVLVKIVRLTIFLRLVYQIFQIFICNIHFLYFYSHILPIGMVGAKMN